MNKKKHFLILLILAVNINSIHTRAEGNIKLDELYCMDDKAYKSVLGSINQEIDKITNQHELVKSVDSMIKFSQESRPLVNFLGKNGDKLKSLQDAHQSNSTTDFSYLKEYYSKQKTSLNADRFMHLMESNRLARIQSDFHLISLGILSKSTKQEFKNQEEKNKFISDELEKYSAKYSREETGFKFPPNFLESVKVKLQDAINKPVKNIHASIPKINEQDTGFEDFVDAYTDTTTDPGEDTCKIIALQEARPDLTDEDVLTDAKNCADRIELQDKYFASIVRTDKSVLTLDSKSPEKVYFRSFTNDSLITRSENIKPSIERKRVSEDDKKDLKNKIYSTLTDYNKLMRENWDNEKQIGLHDKIQQSYNTISFANNGTSLFNKSQPYDCAEISEETESSKLKDCLAQIQEINRYDAKTNSYPLINRLMKMDPTNLESEQKTAITDLMKNGFPSEKLVAYLNLLNFAKNKYLSNSDNDPKCEKTQELASCVQNHEKSFHTGLKTILKLGDKLQSNYSTANSLAEIDQAAIKSSCDLINPTEGVIKLMCNGIKIDNIKSQSSAYARYQRGEIPFHDGQSWKWKKKTTNLELFTAGTLHGIQQGFPTWLNLMQTKGAIRYETDRAIYMKQYNYMQNQYMENWMQNYYSNPQTFNNGYYNIFNLNGTSYTTGYGF